MSNAPAGGGAAGDAHGRSGGLPGWALALVFGAVWWILADGAMGSWIVGLPVAVLAAAWSVRHRYGTQARPRPLRFVSFVPYFLLASVRGGLDVARLALGPQRRVQPKFVRLRMALPPGPARRTFINTLSLLPGTLSVRIDGDELLVHELLARGALEADLQVAERQVAPLFGKGCGAPAASRGRPHDG